MAYVRADSEILNAVTVGTEKLAKVLRPNYGPNGRNTVLSRKHDIPLIVNAGKKILPEIQLDDPDAHIGVALLRDAALKVDRQTGDGTIATVILADAMISAGKRMIASGYNPVRLRLGMQKAVPVVEEAILASSIPAKERDILRAVATIASDNQEIGEYVENAFVAVGTDGVVQVTDSQEAQSRVEISDGLCYDYGFQYAGFVDDPVENTVNLEKPYILLVNRKINDLEELRNIFHCVIKETFPLLIITKEMDQKLLDFIYANNYRGVFRVVVGFGPGHGSTMTRNMHALSSKTGGLVIDEDCGLDLSSCGLEICGRVDHAVLKKEKTILKGFSKENKAMVMALRKYTKRLLAETDSVYEIEKLNATLAILAGNSATLVAGGTTEYEMFERMHRMENAVSAIYAALRSGVAPGGGKAYLMGVPALDKLIENAVEEERMGMLCVAEALRAPTRIIAENAGYRGSAIVGKLEENLNDSFWGFDAATGTFRDLRMAGILDPAETLCVAFRTAADIAGIILTVSGAVVGDEEKK